jgi:hypothetical protein
MKKFILIFISIFTLTFSAKAQDGLESILLSGVADASKLTEAYINPAMKGLIFSMNGGWYHTAKVHKKFGFDISIGASLSQVPTSDEIFNVANLQLSSNITQSPATSPTVAGLDNAATNGFEITIPANSDPDINGGIHPELRANFTMPGGSKDDLPLNAVPAPAVQFNLGLPYKLEAMLRLVPKVGSDNVKGQLLGIGLKKEITSWFGPLDKLPLHVSLLAAYTSMNVDYDIQNDTSINGSGQNAEFKLNSYTIEALASLNFPIINFFGGFGYNSGNSTLKMNGEYILEYQPVAGGPTSTKTLRNPLSLDFDAGGFKTTLGTRISLGFFKIFGSYTFQEYNTINAGIAFSIR